MSGYVKGMRKSKLSPIRDIRIGGFDVPFGAVIILLLAAVYVIFLFGSRLEQGIDSLVLKVLSFAIFVVFAYLVRKDLLRLKPFIKVIDIFLALSLLPLFWDLAQFFYLYVPFTGINGLAIMNTVNAALTLALAIGLLYYEKDRLSEVYVRPGNLKSGLTIGLIGFTACAVLALAGVYFFYPNAIANIDATLPVLAALCLFSLMGAVTEEIWFRGLFLSRLLPLMNVSVSLVIQAVVFALFEAVIAYTLMPQAFFVIIVLLAALLPGYYWGRLTIQNEGILGPTLFHAGFYLLMAMPVFFSALT